MDKAQNPQAPVGRAHAAEVAWMAAALQAAQSAECRFRALAGLIRDGWPDARIIALAKILYPGQSARVRQRRGRPEPGASGGAPARAPVRGQASAGPREQRLKRWLTLRRGRIEEALAGARADQHDRREASPDLEESKKYVEGRARNWQQAHYEAADLPTTRLTLAIEGIR
jgi:hypothetical protein